MTTRTRRRRRIPEFSSLAHLPGLEVLHLINTGGMGAVYAARQAADRRMVALKVLSPESSLELACVARFLHEAEILSRLDHAHIVKYYGRGVTGLLHWFIMEHVEALTLRQTLLARIFSPWEAFVLVRQIVDALVHIHAAGIIHRDLKPDNVLVTAQGQVKLIDFGVALKVGQSYAITTPGMVVGTYKYMAPEQVVDCLRVDQRADLFPVGLILYELLTGLRPHRSLPLLSDLCDVDERVDQLVLRCLAPRPEQRWPSALLLREAIDALLAGGSLGVDADIAKASPTPGALSTATLPIQHPSTVSTCSHWRTQTTCRQG